MYAVDKTTQSMIVLLLAVIMPCSGDVAGHFLW